MDGMQYPVAEKAWNIGPWILEQNEHGFSLSDERDKTRRTTLSLLAARCLVFVYNRAPNNVSYETLAGEIQVDINSPIDIQGVLEEMKIVFDHVAAHMIWAAIKFNRHSCRWKFAKLRTLDLPTLEGDGAEDAGGLTFPEKSDPFTSRDIVQSRRPVPFFSPYKNLPGFVIPPGAARGVVLKVEYYPEKKHAREIWVTFVVPLKERGRTYHVPCRAPSGWLKKVGSLLPLSPKTPPAA